jgi:hypothetical protein
VAKNVSIEHEFSFKALDLSLQTLMPWNSLTCAHYVGCVALLTLMGLPGTLPQHNEQGLTIP